MTDSKELVELAKRGGLEMTQGSSVGTSPASARLRGDSVASVGLEFEHLMDLDAGLSGVPVVFDGPSPRRRTGSAGSASDGLGPAFAMDFEDPEGAESASRGDAVPSRHRCVSFPGEQVVGGLFFDFEAVRTASSDRDAPRMTWSRRWRRRDHPRVYAERLETARNRRSDHPRHREMETSRVKTFATQVHCTAATTTTPTRSRRRRCVEGRDLLADKLLHRRSRPTRGRWLVPRPSPEL